MTQQFTYYKYIFSDKKLKNCLGYFDLSNLITTYNNEGSIAYLKKSSQLSGAIHSPEVDLFLGLFDQIENEMSDTVLLIDLGPGNGMKTKIAIDKIRKSGRKCSAILIDYSSVILESCKSYLINAGYIERPLPQLSTFDFENQDEVTFTCIHNNFQGAQALASLIPKYGQRLITCLGLTANNVNFALYLSWIKWLFRIDPYFDGGDKDLLLFSTQFINTKNRKLLMENYLNSISIEFVLGKLVLIGLTLDSLGKLFSVEVDDEISVFIKFLKNYSYKSFYFQKGDLIRILLSKKYKNSASVLQELGKYLVCFDFVDDGNYMMIVSYPRIEYLMKMQNDSEG